MRDYTTPFFVALCVLYFFQAVVVYRMSSQTRNVIGSDDTAFTIRVRVAALLVNGGLSNIWQFLILALFVPVFFASLNHAVKLFDNDNATALHFTHVYCMSTIIVLITLEFAYIHSLRQKIGSWTSMLLVALALDFATLMVFIFAVGEQIPNIDGLPPIASDSSAAESAQTDAAADSLDFSSTVIYMLVTTFLAFVSTISTLIIAQTVAILADGRVDFPFDSSRQNEADTGDVRLSDGAGFDSVSENAGTSAVRDTVEQAEGVRSSQDIKDEISDSKTIEQEADKPREIGS